MQVANKQVDIVSVKHDEPCHGEIMATSRPLIQTVRLFRRVCLIVAATFAVSTPAESVDWLYDVELAVESQGDTERIRAMRRGLETVLVRVTGLRELPESAELADAMRQVDAYQLQFRYENVISQSNSAASMRLIVNYDAVAIHRLISLTELPVWSAQRPHVLFLISNDFQGKRRVLNAIDDLGSQEALRKTASLRGLAFNLPLMDLQDRTLLPEGAIAFQFAEATRPLRLRMRADAVVTARIDSLRLGVHRIWLSIREESLQAMMVFDTSEAEDALAEVVHRTADHLSRRYAIASRETTALRLVVVDISKIEEYTSVLDYLERWEFIDRVLVSEVVGTRFEFELITASTWAQFAVYLAEDGLLVQNQARESLLDQAPEFRWFGSR